MDYGVCPNTSTNVLACTLNGVDRRAETSRLLEMWGEDDDHCCEEIKVQHSRAFFFDCKRLSTTSFFVPAATSCLVSSEKSQRTAKAS